MLDCLYNLIACEMVGSQQARSKYRRPTAEPYDFQFLHDVELFFEFAVEGRLPRAVECAG